MSAVDAVPRAVGRAFDLLEIVVSEGVRLAVTGSAFDANGTRPLNGVGGTWRLYEAV